MSNTDSFTFALDRYCIAISAWFSWVVLMSAERQEGHPTFSDSELQVIRNVRYSRMYRAKAALLEELNGLPLLDTASAAARVASLIDFIVDSNPSARPQHLRTLQGLRLRVPPFLSDPTSEEVE